MHRATTEARLAAMVGKEIGGMLRSDGSARLQWPDADGSIPVDMQRFRVTRAALEDTALVMDLENDETSFRFRAILWQKDT